MEHTPTVKLSDPIKSLRVHARICNRLIDESIFTIGQLTETSTHKLLKIKGIGQNSLDSVRITLDEHGYSLQETSSERVLWLESSTYNLGLSRVLADKLARAYIKSGKQIWLKSRSHFDFLAEDELKKIEEILRRYGLGFDRRWKY